ncbi:MAG: S9 family peptidase [Pseudomonadota bacterium]
MTRLVKPKSAPSARLAPEERAAHGTRWTDEYAWLRADNWRDVIEDPAALPQEIRAHLEAEAAYCEEALSEAASLRRELYEEMRGRIKEDDASPPAPDGPYAYYSKYRTGGAYPIFARRPVQSDGALGEEQILLDGDAFADGAAYMGFASVEHSPDHRLLAVAFDDRGSELYRIRIFDIETGAPVRDDVPGTAGPVVWANDSDTFYYTLRDENFRANRVMRASVARSGAAPELVYREEDPAFHLSIDQTSDRAYVLISLHESSTTEIRVIDADAPAAHPQLISARETGVEYDVEHRDNVFFVRTNKDGAKDFQIMTAPADAPQSGNWRPYVAAASGCLRLSHHLFAGHLAYLERRDALPSIVINDLASGDAHEIAFDEPAYHLSIRAGFEFDTTRLRFVYSSPTTPRRTYDYDMATRERTLIKEEEPPSGHDPSDYVTERLFAEAKDGAQIPVTVLRRAGDRKPGPLLLYGYGAYGHTIPAAFSTKRLSLVDRGFAYAIAHIRGGMAKGYGWYEDGKLTNKKNSFSDFIAAGERLVEQGYTERGRIVAHGGSAGGLLVGASVNMAPDLFAGVIADVPFVDVLNTMLDDTLPLTPPEWTEWGDPIRDRGAFDYIRSYSPYDNVRATDYPHILATTGVSDPRVTYWEPAKWVARLRAQNTADTLTLFHVNIDAGHGGKSGRFEGLEEVARAYAFALMTAS